MRNAKLLSVVVACALPCVANAAPILVEALDFTGGGSAWTMNLGSPGYDAAPPTFELDGDPTNVGIASVPGLGWWNFNRQVFAPAGYTMSDVRVEALGSGFSSWVTMGRLGLGLAPVATAPAASYWVSAGDYLGGGAVHVDIPMVLNSAGNPAFSGLTSVFVDVEVIKYYPSLWVPNNVRQVKVYAELTAIPEPASFGLISLGAMTALTRRVVKRR